MYFKQNARYGNDSVYWAFREKYLFLRAILPAGLTLKKLVSVQKLKNWKDFSDRKFSWSEKRDHIRGEIQQKHWQTANMEFIRRKKF